MWSRLVVALVLSIAAVPFVLLGLIDPLEGGLVLLLALVIGLTAWGLSGVRPPRITWLPFVITLGIAVVTLALALGHPASGGVETTADAVGIAIRFLVWVYRLSVVVTFIGAVVYVVRIAQALRTDVRAVRSQDAS
ncbi:MAG: hypothetical protein RL347_631 [Actinomycetota bacterium]|jgi:hypothetical protein